MDPLSIAASALTVLGTVAWTKKSLKFVLSLRHVREELMQLSNEVSRRPSIYISILSRKTIVQLAKASDLHLFRCPTWS